MNFSRIISVVTALFIMAAVAGCGSGSSKNSDADLSGSDTNDATITQDSADMAKQESDTVQAEADALQSETDAFQPEADILQLDADNIEPEADTIQPEADSLQPDGDSVKTDFEKYADCVFDKVNAFRAAHSKPVAYIRDTKLDEVAVYYSTYMADNNVFAHSADGKSFGDRLDSYGVKWTSAGENLQKNSMSAWAAACEETVNGSGGWANSTQGHREAMLGQDTSGKDKGWTHAGAGVAKGGGSWYVTMYFVKY